MATGLHLAPDIAAENPADPPEIRAASRRSRALGWLASVLLHGIVFALLIGLWSRQAPEEAPPITVTFVSGNGAAGAQGGSGGGPETGPMQEGAAERTPGVTQDKPAPLSQPQESQPQAADTPEVPTPPPAPVAAPPEPRPSPPHTIPLRAETVPPPPPHKPTPPARMPVASAPSVPQPPPQVASNPTPASTPGTPGMGHGSGGAVGRGTGAAGAGRAAMGAGDLSALGDDYLDRLRRHIRRFMVYPEAAKKQKQQGEGVMTVLLRRDGTVVDVWIARSSGYLVLDQAALKAVQNSSRVPPFPDRFPNAEGEIDLPFDFHLGFLDRVFN